MSLQVLCWTCKEPLVTTDPSTISDDSKWIRGAPWRCPEGCEDVIGPPAVEVPEVELKVTEPVEDTGQEHEPVELLRSAFRAGCEAKFCEGAEEGEGGSGRRAERAHQRFSKAQIEFDTALVALRSTDVRECPTCAADSEEDAKDEELHRALRESLLNPDAVRTLKVQEPIDPDAYRDAWRGYVGPHGLDVESCPLYFDGCQCPPPAAEQSEQGLEKRLLYDLGVEIQRPYPLSAFREPTPDEFEKAHEALTAVGLSTDVLSASMARHIGQTMIDGNPRFEHVVEAALRSSPPVTKKPYDWVRHACDECRSGDEIVVALVEAQKRIDADCCIGCGGPLFPTGEQE